ncbi:MAG: HNH endonuclease [Bdellovibrionaceae bacterium]|nr:HNH endonuclease [Pseudobdellovibrionaceae bacterium]
MEDWYIAAPPEHQKREKEAARLLRKSAWWKSQLGKGLCAHCGKRFSPAELTMDHLLPIARGGKSTKKNCVPSCKTCNTEKGSKTRAELALAKLGAGSDE